MDKQWVNSWGFKSIDPSANISSTIYNAMDSIA